MKILVTAKRVEDPESKIKVKPDGTGIVTEGLKYKINPFDEIAVEEALRLVAKHGGEVVVVSIGGKEVQEQLRHALAMGAAPRGVGEPRGPAGSAGRRRAAPEGRREGEARPRHPRQAVHRRRPEPGRPVPRRVARLGPGHVRLQGRVARVRAGEEQGARRSCVGADGKTVRVVREVDGGLPRWSAAAGGRHHRPAPQPAALRVAARAS